MARRLLLLLLLCVGLARGVSAQTAVWPYTTSNALAWGSPAVNGTPAQAQALVPRLYLDGATTFTPVTTSITCTAPVPPATEVPCQAPLAPALVTLFNTWLRGNHTLAMTLYDPTTSVESGKSAPFSSTVPPGAPIAFSIK